LINYRIGKKRYKINELGSLYINTSKVSNNEQPIIYVGGQMDHRGHVLEKSSYTNDIKHNLYTGSWMYEYPVFSNSKDQINAKNFSENLIASLREAKLSKVILLTHSHGGIVGSYASKSDLVEKVICVHSPLLGTPLANPNYFNSYKELLTKSQQLILKLMKVIVNSKYGFQQDNFYGLDLNQVDLNKIIAVGNYLDLDSEQNKVMLETFELIRKVTGYRSDGVVIFEPSEFEIQGINYIQTPEAKNHINSIDSDFFENVLSRVLSK